MHKLKLTSAECEIIKGSETIIRTLGCFPSMENGELISAFISFSEHGRCNLTLRFDIDGWKEMAKLKPDECSFTESSLHILEIIFTNAREVSIGPNLALHRNHEVKFWNHCDKSKMFRDELPESIKEIPRPFFAFSIGKELIVEFFEDECTISAKLIS